MIEGESGRSIPARTGEPDMTCSQIVVNRVYPRTYGGTVPDGKLWRWHDGLSPHVRGNLLKHRDSILSSRSIPARTGEPNANGDVKQQPEVYPRTYGGTAFLSALPFTYTGLSPHVRGNHGRTAHDCPLSGSIPARTGEPIRPASRRSFDRVYPRTYGGTGVTQYRVLGLVGLSPHVRGNPDHVLHTPERRRSIPARTGEPGFSSARFELGRVYPRTYGGTETARRSNGVSSGLSPHVRGNPLRFVPC